MNILVTFVLLSIINVVFSTVRSITTIKSGKTIASLISGGYFAFYNIMLIYTVADFPMWEKCLITFVCNVVGVYAVKFGEEKMRKDKLWKVEMTVKVVWEQDIVNVLEALKIPYSYFRTENEKYVVFDIYCATQKESLAIKEVVKKYNAKYFVTESKTL